MSIFFNIASTSLRRISQIPVYIPAQATVNTVNSDFSYSLYDIAEGNYNKRSAFATLKFYTSNPTVTFEYYSPLIDAMPAALALGRVSIFDENWNYITRLTPTDTPNVQTETLNLGKTGVFYAVESGNTNKGPLYPPIGTYITKASVASGGVEIQTIPSTANRIVVAGDSISVGDGSDQASRYGWQIRLRELLRTADWGITSQGYGSLTIYDFVRNDTTQTNAANQALSEFTGATGRKIYIWVAGTNDFGYVTTDPLQVAPMAAAVWDKIYAADNTAEVILITPLWRSDKDTPKGTGNWVLRDYHDAFMAEAATRAFVTGYDGIPILDPNTDFSADNLHPNNAGHLKMANYVNSIL